MKTRQAFHLFLFFGLAFLISWGIWILLLIRDSSNQLLFWLAGYGPTLAALLMLSREPGVSGYHQLLKSLSHWRVNMCWYWISLFGTPLVMALALGLHVLLGGATPQLLDPQHLVTELEQWPLVFLVIGYILVFTSLGEEPGWRGYALPRLLASFAPFTASLILGLVWAVWHLPLFWMVNNFHADLPFSWFFLQVLGSTFLYTWLYLRSNGSLLLMLLFHTSSNAAVGLLPVLPLDNAGSLRPLWLLVGLLWFLVALVVWFERARFFRLGDADFSSQVGIRLDDQGQ